MLKKVFALVVTLSFLVNSICYADLLALKESPADPPDTLSPESRLSPITDNSVMLDIMKLTTEISDLASRENIALRERADYCELPVIDEITTATAPQEITRPGDKMVIDFRNKVVLENAVFIPCAIEGVRLGAQESTSRYYLCCAKRKPEGGYRFEFIPTASEDLNNKEIDEALQDNVLLKALAKKTRIAKEKRGIDRFVEQQKEDRIIAEAILSGTAERPLEAAASGRRTYIDDVADFLADYDFAVAPGFLQLKEFGQLMGIPGLKKPQSGGVGIYLPPDEIYHNAGTLVHEIFAKCGFSDPEAEKMADIYEKLTTNQPLDDREEDLLRRARTVTFDNRWDDILNIDYHKGKDGFLVPIETLKGDGHNWYLGIDSSTQSVKFRVIEKAGATKRVIWTHTESFDDPHYKETFGATAGVLPHPQAPEQYHTDPLMLADALDRGMETLSREFTAQELYLSNLKTISGAGQQHGTVYLNTEAEEELENLIPSGAEVALWEELQMARILSKHKSPIWQDGTTDEEVAKITRQAGSEDRVRDMTGSRATRRFSLAQIMAAFNRRLSMLRGTARVLNIAAFNGALLTADAKFPWDPGDGAGTNAMDIRTKMWLAPFIDMLVPGLSRMLSPIMPSDQVVGRLSRYWVEKYGFSPDTEVVNWTGDNPSAMTGMGVIEEGEVVISLGTSYTMYTFVGEKDLEDALGTPIGHIFGEPTGQYMNLVCAQNGDKTLDTLRERYISEEEALARAAAKSIEVPSDKKAKDDLIKDMRLEIFTEELEKTPAGNDGAMMVAMHKTEDLVRIPFIEGRTFARNLDRRDRPQVFRAAVEGQAYFLKWVADQIGLEPSKIKLTGGVSNNPVVRQIIADIFNAQVEVLKDSEAVAMGSAIRAMKAHESITWEEAVSGLVETDETKTVAPRQDNVDTYRSHFAGFEGLLNEAIFNGRVYDTMEYHANAFGIEGPQAMADGAGRVNLLGEHTDYAGGDVLPIALDGLNVIAAVSTRTDGKIVIASPRFGKYEISVEDLKKIPAGQKEGLKAIPEESGWARYPLGVVRQLMELPGVDIKGLNISYDGNVPLGGGLSSSAAVETAVFTALREMMKIKLDKDECARLCMRAEHWRGNICGIMDQFVSLYGRQGKAILLNCNTLESKEVDISFLDTAGYAIVAVDTCLEKTDEAWQKYMARCASLKEAVDKLLKTRYPAIQTMLDIAPNLTPAQFEEIGNELLGATNQEVFSRVQHVVYEQARVKRLVEIAKEANALAALVRSGDESARPKREKKIGEFGAILVAGHKSLQEQYEMSSDHLDTLVTSALQHGSVGSRLTGAGIVGCTVNIVRKADLGKFRRAVAAEYREAFPESPRPKFTVSRAGDGARPVELVKAAPDIPAPPEEAATTAKAMKKLLKGPSFTSEQMAKLDDIVLDLLMNKPAVCVELLRKGADKAVAARIIGQLALPKVASQAAEGDRGRYLRTALDNPDIAGVAKGVKAMLQAGAAFRAFTPPQVLSPWDRCTESEVVEGITSLRCDESRVSDSTPRITYYDQAGWGALIERIKLDNKVQNVTKPPQTTILEQHPNAHQYFYVEEGELMILAISSDGLSPFRAYLLKKGDVIKIAAGTFHIAVNKTPNVKFWVWNEDSGQPGQTVKQKTTITCIGETFDMAPKVTYYVANTGVAIRGSDVLRMHRDLPKEADWSKPQIVEETFAPNAGSNRVSMKVRILGRPEPEEVVDTEEMDLETLARELAYSADKNPHGKRAFTVGGAVVGPFPNRGVGEVVEDEVKLLPPTGGTVSVPANHEGSTVPKLHLHGSFHLLEQGSVTPGREMNRSASVATSVDVKGRTRRWPWPSNSNITTRRALTSENKSVLTVRQENTGKEKTWASWVDHTRFKHPRGLARDNVRLHLPADEMTPVTKDAEGRPDYEDCLPDGTIVSVKDTPYDFTAPEGRPLGKLFLDDNFTGLRKQPDGSVVVEVFYPEIGCKLRITVRDKVIRKNGNVETGKLKSIQVYSPDDAKFVCVEVGTHLNDPFNEERWGDTDTGMVELDPGDAYEYTYEVEYLPIEEEIAQRIAEDERRAKEGLEQALPSGITKTAIDLSAGEASSNKTVVFVSQDFATKERCKELMGAFPDAEFVTFNQHTELGDMADKVSDTKYAGRKKVLVTLGLTTDQMRRMISGKEEKFADVMPLNIDGDGVGELRGTLRRSFQKGVLAIGLLASGIPKGADYRSSNSYLVLKALLTMMFGNEEEADRYITNLVNPEGALTVTMRFGHLIGRLLGPVQKILVNGFTQIVNIFA